MASVSGTFPKYIWVVDRLAWRKITFEIISVGRFLRDEYMLTPFTAFWAPERQLSLLNISGSEFQHFTDSHSARAISSRMSRSLGLSVLKMIPSMTSFSIIYHAGMAFALSTLRKIGVEQGLWKSGPTLAVKKLKRTER
jgi:hypothetical protein